MAFLQPKDTDPAVLSVAMVIHSLLVSTKVKNNFKKHPAVLPFWHSKPPISTSECLLSNITHTGTGLEVTEARKSIEAKHESAVHSNNDSAFMNASEGAALTHGGLKPNTSKPRSKKRKRPRQTDDGKNKIKHKKATRILLLQQIKTFVVQVIFMNKHQ